MGVVFGIGRLPLQYNLKIPVAVQITDRRIVGRIGANLTVGHRLRLRLLQRDVYITARGIGRKRPFAAGRRFFTTVYHRTYLIYRFSPGGVIIVKLCGNSHRFRSNQQAVAIHIEYRTHRIGGQITPTHHDRIGDSLTATVPRPRRSSVAEKDALVSGFLTALKETASFSCMATGHTAPTMHKAEIHTQVFLRLFFMSLQLMTVRI